MVLRRLKLNFESRACDRIFHRWRSASTRGVLALVAKSVAKLHLRLYDVATAKHDVAKVLAKKHTVSAGNEREMRTRDIPGPIGEFAPPGRCGKSVGQGRGHKVQR